MSRQNQVDTQDLPSDVKDTLDFKYVDHAVEVIGEAFSPESLQKIMGNYINKSRL